MIFGVSMVFPLIIKGKLKNFRVSYADICSATE